MPTLEIDEKLARKLYPSAAPDLKKMLETNFGKDLLVVVPIIERANSVVAALAIVGKTIEQIISPTDTKYEAAYKVIKAVIAVLNEDWVADYSNSSQEKYEPRFRYQSGFGLAYDGYDYWASASVVGSRLTYKSYDTMIHGVEILKDYYNDYLN